MTEPLDAPIAISIRDLLEIKTSLTRLTEQFAAFAVAAEHRHGNLKQSLDAFLPRREAEAEFASGARRMAAIEADLATKAETSVVNLCAPQAQADETDRRLKRVEAVIDRVIWGLLAAGGLMAGNLLVLGFKH